MSIYIQGKDADMVGILQGDEDVIEVWQGDDLIWPDITGSSGYIMIEPPKRDNTDYAYWQHALSDIEDGSINNAQYLKFVVDGEEYYINRAPRGKQKVILEGNMIKLDARQQKALAGKIGEYLPVKAKIPSRYSAWRKFTNYDSTAQVYKARWTETLLPDSHFEISAYKGQKREWAYAQMIKAVSYPSNKEISLNHSWSIQQQGRYNFSRSSRSLTISDIVNTDNSVELHYNVYGSTGCRQGVAIWFPAFEKEFQLKVIAQS